ncbi:cholinesterase 2-like [Asterias rubens]|uniref:cholinesterase 2-like n=1 Tax=Asterias rubens TaxID=7604 RepID=UPI001455D789|nr:cholinesterase 2-like [Asterias rubens]
MSSQSGGVPVMVWIHGGGYTAGSATLPDYNGFALAAVGDVIVVSINYRLGIFGFLTTDDETLPGNVGLIDQVVALKWIKQNIAAFGGDSERITIFGESAGSASVSFHILSKMSEGLFNQAIMQSGTALAPWSYYDNKKEMRDQAFEMGEATGCTTSDSATLVECLRQQDANELLAKSIERVRISPVLDGVFLEDLPLNLYNSGRFNHATILLGTNADEGSLILLLDPELEGYYASEAAPVITRQQFKDGLSDQLTLQFGSTNRQVETAISTWYIDWSQAENMTADYYKAVVDVGTDLYFACNTDSVARYHAIGGDDVFLYQFTHIPSVSIYDIEIDGEFYGPGWTGATHAEEIPLVLGTPFIPETARLRAEFRDSEKALSVKFMEFWSNFARSGNPGLETAGSQPATGADYWPMFTIPELRYKELDMNFGTGRALKSNECNFWNSFLPQLGTMIASIDEVEREWRDSYSAWKYTDMADWREQFSQYKALTGN